MPIDNILRSALKNGKSAVKNSVRNGVKNGINGNGIKNGINAITEGNLAKRQYVIQQKAKRQAANTSELTFEAGNAGQPINLAREYANKSTAVQITRNRRRPGAGSMRANRSTSRKAAHSVIFSDSKAIKDAYPDQWDSIKAEVESWNRGGYAYARDITTGTIDEPLKGYPKWIGPDGRKWRLKSKARFGQGYRLSGIDTGKLKSYGSKRTTRENPWTNEDEMDELMKALAKYGKADKFAKLVKIMKKDFDRGMAEVKASGKDMTKGHLISLEDGGLDVAENFVPQPLRNTRVKVDGEWVTKLGNAGEGSGSTAGIGAGRGIDSWDEYVRLKLSQL